MYRLLFNLVFGLAMVGCTTNNVVTTNTMYTLSMDSVSVSEVTNEGAVERYEVIDEKVVKEAASKVACTDYRPLPVPSPVQIDINKIKQLTNADDVNRLLVANIATLNKQMRNYKTAAATHHKAWLDRCKKSK